VLCLIVCLIGLGSAWPSQAQEADSAPQQQGTQDETSATQADPDAPGDPAALDEAGVPLDPQQSAGRFIPTEEISQDLGVSFPVDI
jgi:hypothetical protein